ncbi:hypothetical protein GALL_115330 [mine drainage metagenome]|uniref:Uncharacterized protein n=1 Tax=mine drainage metagenome TaxID=410659 RepID=A0A1J5SD86_9ZZZZ
MKTITILTSTASATLGAFFLTIGAGYISLTLFLAAAVAWVILLTVYAYTPRERTWLPKLPAARAECQTARTKASYPLAA